MYLASDEILQCHQPSPIVMERRWKSNVELAPNCPRCASSNTKFCYYNNYSLSQPRYFCKGCRRYWTRGGSLRNVPVGGGCRKSRRMKAVRQLPSDDGSSGAGFAASDPSMVPAVTGTNTGPDIDLAAVFAKYVNHSAASGSSDEANPWSDLSGSSNQEGQLDDLFVDCQTQSSTTDEGEQLLAELPEGFSCGDDFLHEAQDQGFTDHEPHPFGLQPILSDELAQDLLWVQDTTLPNLSWQPTMQLQDFGSFPCDDQTKILTNIGDNNWSLFDLPAYEIFSRP